MAKVNQYDYLRIHTTPDELRQVATALAHKVATMTLGHELATVIFVWDGEKKIRVDFVIDPDQMSKIKRG